MALDDRRAVAVSRRLDLSQAGRDGQAIAASDPYLAAWLNVLTPERALPRFESGTIVDAMPGGYAYLVSAGFRSFVWCSPGGTASGFGTIGARQLTTYPIGSLVYFVRQHQTPERGTIIAAEPPYMLAQPDQWPADGIWPFIRSGQHVEPAHAYPVGVDMTLAAARSNNLRGLDLPDFSAGRPIDATSSGEWGAIMETGVGVFADSFQAFLRADEATGVFAFYNDQVLRVAGHNYQFASSHRESEELEDEGELTGWTRRTVFPWESYGLWRFNQVAPSWLLPTIPNYGLGGGQGSVPVDPSSVQTGSGFAVREPEGRGALPAARLYEWSGYLGQGGRSQISAPVQIDWAYPALPAPSVRSAAVAADTTPDGGDPGGRLLLQGDLGGDAGVVAKYVGAWDLASGTFTPGDTVIGGSPAAGMWVSLYAAGSNPSSGFMVRILTAGDGGFVVDPQLYEGDVLASQGNVTAIVWSSTTGTPYALPVNQRGTTGLDGPDQPGLFIDQKSLAGKWFVGAAGGILFTKRAVLPTPRPLRRVEDPAGDNPENYAASGIDPVTGAITHHVASNLYSPEDAAQRVCMVPDALAYALNWEGLHPFAYHENDWFVAEEGVAGSDFVNQLAPEYDTLAELDYLATPPPQYLDVDHRYGLVPIYQTEAYWGMLEDGSVVVKDGWGSEIRMTGGNIELHCSGDIRLFNGRNLIAWAGHDVDIKAQDSVDLAAERFDLRTQAGRNSHHLAGNTGSGGYLFEAKSTCPINSYCGQLGEAVTSSGFTVLAPKSQIWLQGQDVISRLEPTASDGRIVFDAGNTNDIHMVSKTFVYRAPTNGAFVQLFGTTGTNEFTGTYALLNGPLYVGAAVTAAGGVAGADPGIAGRLSYLLTSYAGDFDATIYTPAGSECAEFSHRTENQYLSANFAFWQSAWQSIAIGDAQELPTWSEPAVVGLRSGAVTRPHPGERWGETGSYRSHEFTFADPDAGWLSIPRGENQAAYELPITPVATALALASNFLLPFQEPDACPVPAPPACDFSSFSGDTATLSIPNGPYAGDWTAPWTLGDQGLPLDGGSGDLYSAVFVMTDGTKLVVNSFTHPDTGTQVMSLTQLNTDSTVAAANTIFTCGPPMTFSRNNFFGATGGTAVTFTMG